MAHLIDYRVRISEDHWTPFRNEIFENWPGDLRQRDAAAFYALMYDRAFHRSSPIVKATLTDLSEWSRLEPHVVRACLKELNEKQLIHAEKGSLYDATRKHLWGVPLATVDLKLGWWTPVPRFLIHEYIPAYPNSVLLLLLLHYQHSNWIDSCWSGALRLSKQIGWPEDRVRRALNTMSIPAEWKALGTHLPTPLARSSEFNPDYGRNVTLYRVRAVRYEKLAEQPATVRLRKFVRKKFNVPSPEMA